VNIEADPSVAGAGERVSYTLETVKRSAHEGSRTETVLLGYRRGLPMNVGLTFGDW
jgi:hypothetical protein